MKLRATVRIRNDAMISARERMGLSQGRLAELAEVPMGAVVRLEHLDYTTKSDAEHAEKLSLALSVPVDDIFPDDLIGMRFQSESSQVRHIPTIALLETAQEERLLLPCFEDHIDTREMVAAFIEKMPSSHPPPINSCRTARSNKNRVEILKSYYGLEGRSPERLTQIAKRLGMTSSYASNALHQAEAELKKAGWKELDKAING